MHLYIHIMHPSIPDPYLWNINDFASAFSQTELWTRLRHVTEQGSVTALNTFTANGLQNNLMENTGSGGGFRPQENLYYSHAIMQPTLWKCAFMLVCECKLGKLCPNELNSRHWVLLKRHGIRSRLIRRLAGAAGCASPLAGGQACSELRPSSSSWEREAREHLH